MDALRPLASYVRSSGDSASLSRSRWRPEGIEPSQRVVGESQVGGSGVGAQVADAGRPGDRDHRHAVYPLTMMHPGQCDLSGRGLVGAADLVQGSTQATGCFVVGWAPSLV